MDSLGKIAHRAFMNSGTRGATWASLRASTQRLWDSGAAAVLTREPQSVAGAAFHGGMMEDTGLHLNHLPQWEDCCESLKFQYELAASAVLRAARRPNQEPAAALAAALRD